jgi:hypothetical protein
MKIKPEHFEHMRREIQRVVTAYPNVVEAYEAGNFPRADRVKDLQKRFCFDLLYAASLLPFIVEHVYPYANDEHIYTALLRICPTVNRKYTSEVTGAEEIQVDDQSSS